MHWDADDEDDHEMARNVFKAILGLPFTTNPDHPPFPNVNEQALDVLVDMERMQPGSTR